METPRMWKKYPELLRFMWYISLYPCIKMIQHDPYVLKLNQVTWTEMGKLSLPTVQTLEGMPSLLFYFLGRDSAEVARFRPKEGSDGIHSLKSDFFRWPKKGCKVGTRGWIKHHTFHSKQGRLWWMNENGLGMFGQSEATSLQSNSLKLSHRQDIAHRLPCDRSPYAVSNGWKSSRYAGIIEGLKEVLVNGLGS